MIFRGFSRTFSTKNGEQFRTIGAYWDRMSALYGRDNLRGLGYGWTAESIVYVIGLKSNESFDIDKKGGNLCWKEVPLPDTGWVEYTGRTDDLAALYDEIYRDGPLTYEIEECREDGSCTILITRDQVEQDGK